MNKNEFKVKRTAIAQFPIDGTAVAIATYKSGVVVPAGAIVTGIRIMPGSAIVGANTTNAAATCNFLAGAEALCATHNISIMPTVSIISTTAVTAAAGKYLTADGELQLQVAINSDSASCSGTFNYYVDYMYIGS